MERNQGATATLTYLENFVYVFVIVIEMSVLLGMLAFDVAVSVFISILNGFTFLLPDNNNNNDRLTAFDPGQPG